MPPLAGCLGFGDDNGESELGTVTVENHHDESQTAELRIEWEEEVILDEQYDLGRMDPDTNIVPDEAGVLVERVWPDEPGDFTVSFRRTNEEWTTVTPSEYEYPECFSVYCSLRDGESAPHVGVRKSETGCFEE